MDDCPADRPYCVVTKVTLGEDTVTNAMLCRADTRSESKKADLLSECKETSTARLPQERPVYATLTLQGVTIPAANKWLGDQGIVSHEAIRNMYIVELPEGEEVEVFCRASSSLRVRASHFHVANR